MEALIKAGENLYSNCPSCSWTKHKLLKHKNQNITHNTTQQPECMRTHQSPKAHTTQTTVDTLQDATMQSPTAALQQLDSLSLLATQPSLLGSSRTT
jgi:hypothetical protein